MAKLSYNTLVNRLVEHYSADLNETQAQGMLDLFKAEYDRKMAHAPADWDFMFQNRNVFGRLQLTLNHYFSSHGYEWLLAQYKQLKEVA
jgi:hypothetical protein